MKSHIKLILCLSAGCLSAILCTQVFAQASFISAEKTQKTTTTSNAVVAYVYVSSTPAGGSKNEIEVFSAAQDGKLTPITGSPFQDNVTDMVVSGGHMFAANNNGFDIDSFAIESDGGLHYLTSTNTAQTGDCNTLGPLVLDHTAATLYDMDFNGSGCANNTYESFAIDKSTGGLKDMGNTIANDWLYLPVSFIGNNVFAYTASCIGDMYWEIFGFERSSDGLLSEINISAPTPTPPTGDFYCPSQAAADPTDHVAISMQAVNQQQFTPAGQPQLATYTADAKGNLSTTSTTANMPLTSVVTVTDLKMSPSGKLLAVAGTGGVEVFHFNGSNPITHYTTMLAQHEIDEMFWDNQNHLYAISRSAQKLYVFTVTPTNYSEVSGSPYTISSPRNIAVQPEPW
jgi:hypothetical protein